MTGHIGMGLTPGQAKVTKRLGQPGTRSRIARAKVERQKQDLAEHVANGGAITAWSREEGIDESWAKIRKDLGVQAC